MSAQHKVLFSFGPLSNLFGLIELNSWKWPQNKPAIVSKG